MYDPEGLPLDYINNFDAWIEKCKPNTFDNGHYIYTDMDIMLDDVMVGRIAASARCHDPVDVMFYINTDAGAVYGCGKSCKILDDEAKQLTTFNSDDMIYYHDDRYITPEDPINNMIIKTLEYFDDDFKQIGINTDDINGKDWAEMFRSAEYRFVIRDMKLFDTYR